MKRWAPKVFSGCQTCKYALFRFQSIRCSPPDRRRRIKCDETKPKCQRYVQLVSSGSQITLILCPDVPAQGWNAKAISLPPHGCLTQTRKPRIRHSLQSSRRRSLPSSLPRTGRLPLLVLWPSHSRRRKNSRPSTSSFGRPPTSSRSIRIHPSGRRFCHKQHSNMLL